jgi:small-conductance mechanosensitive channel
MHFILQHWNTLLWSAAVVGGSIVLALLARYLVFFLLKRLIPVTRGKSIIGHIEKASWWLFPFLGLLIALPASSVPPRVLAPVQHAIGLGLIAAVAWLVILASEISAEIISTRYRIDTADNLVARKVQTQFMLLHRVVVVIVIVVTLAVMLMTFPEIRQIGTSLLASAGLAGLIVGMAMRPTLSSLVAGIQIALTQPIRIEDSVVVEGEWGWIEEIGSTYVVVRIWDLRRLVLPLSYFIEHPFQNWTRNTSDLLATVLLWVDYSIPVEEVREELRRIASTTSNWKGDLCILQVTDSTEHAMQLRALLDARDASKAWDLRCYVREKLIDFVRQKYPDSLPRVRAEIRPSLADNGLPAQRDQIEVSSRPLG